MNMKRRSSLDRIFLSQQPNEIPDPRPAPSSNPRHLVSQEEESTGAESDLSERLARIEKRLEQIVRPTLQIRSSVGRLLLSVESLEGQVRGLQQGRGSSLRI